MARFKSCLNSQLSRSNRYMIYTDANVQGVGARNKKTSLAMAAT